MTSPCRMRLWWLAVSVLIGTVVVGSARGATEGEAVTAVDVAESRIVECYSAVAVADKEGVNVSVLLGRLGDAGELLSLAELSYKRGDFNSTVVFTNQSQAVLDGFIEEVEALMEKVVYDSHLDFLVNVVGSAGGALSVVVGSFAFWTFLKKRRG